MTEKRGRSAMEILPGIHQVGGTISSVYLLIDDRDGITVVDTGPGPYERTILKYLTSIGRRPADVRRIILTHRHVDHIGGAAGLRAATNARVWAHPLDAPVIEGRQKERRMPGAVGAIIGRVLPLVFPARPCSVDETLSDGQEIALGASLGTLRVILTPGHTGGHCSLLLPSRSLFLLGDALGNQGGKTQVPFDAVNDDTAQANRTAIAIKETPAENLVFGHGKPILGTGHDALHAAAQKAEANLAKSKSKSA